MDTMDEQAEPLFFIADLREQWTSAPRRYPYITFWRPDDAGYCYALSWAGRYGRSRVIKGRSYYTKKIYGGRCYERFAVPVDAVLAMAIEPRPGLIDGNAGPVLPNDGNTRMALRRLRFHLPERAPAQLAA